MGKREVLLVSEFDDRLREQRLHDAEALRSRQDADESWRRYLGELQAADMAAWGKITAAARWACEKFIEAGVGPEQIFNRWTQQRRRFGAMQYREHVDLVVSGYILMDQYDERIEHGNQDGKFVREFHYALMAAAETDDIMWTLQRSERYLLIDSDSMYGSGKYHQGGGYDDASREGDIGRLDMGQAAIKSYRGLYDRNDYTYDRDRRFTVEGIAQGAELVCSSIVSKVASQVPN